MNAIRGPIHAILRTSAVYRNYAKLDSTPMLSAVVVVVVVVEPT